MNRRRQLNAALAAAAVTLAALLWFTRPAPPSRPEPLLDVVQADIHRIEIRAGHGPPVVLVRGQEHWRLARPISARANEDRIDALLALTQVRPRRRLDASDIDAQQTALDQPVATVQFNNGPRLAIGDRTPLDTGRDARYVRIGDTVALAAIPHPGLLDTGWAQWVDPHVLAEDARLVALQLPEFTLTRADNGGWRVQPASRDEGADAAQVTVTAWRRALALSISPAADQPAATAVTLVFANGDRRELEIVARRPQLILRDRALGIAYHLPGDTAQSLLGMGQPEPGQADRETTQPRQRQSRRKRTADGRNR